MKTIRDFTKQSNIDAGLIRAVIRQSGGWEAFKEDAQMICEHGIDGGYHGWIYYYPDTVPFYGRNRAAINAMAADMARDIGEGGAIELITGFNCLRGDYTADEVGATMYGSKSRMNTQIANALAWFAAEEVARSYVDCLEAE